MRTEAVSKEVETATKEVELAKKEEEVAEAAGTPDRESRPHRLAIL